MPRLCTICSHDQRTEIETQLLAQVTHTKIAEQFGVSRTALSRHRNTHLINRLADAADRKRQANEAQADTLLQRVEEYRLRAVTILDAGGLHWVTMGISGMVDEYRSIANDALGLPPHA